MMSRTRFVFYIGMVLMVLTASCTFSSTPTATVPPATSAPPTSSFSDLHIRSTDLDRNHRAA